MVNTTYSIIQSSQWDLSNADLAALHALDLWQEVKSAARKFELVTVLVCPEPSRLVQKIRLDCHEYNPFATTALGPKLSKTSRPEPPRRLLVYQGT